MNDAETRAEYIDPSLKAAGWGVVEGSRIRREYPIAPGHIEGHGRRGKALTADYVLEYRNTHLAVVEAKAIGEELTEGVGQAKNYAEKLAIRFTYATNGKGIYAIDMETGKEGEQACYPTPDKLWELTFAVPNAWRDRFASVPFEDKGGSHPSRYYQDIAVDRVMEAIAQNHPRILLTLATGTGKTFMSGPPKDGQPSPYFGDYPPDFFDFIVIDECHRGGAKDESTWREILEYFKPAVQLGLTATPKRKDNVDTYAYFGEPVFIYSLKEGINDGFLTPFRVKQIATTLDDYRYAPDDVVMEGEVDEGKLYEERDFNRTLEIQEREKKRVELFLKQIDPREKTLVFCANQAHALLVRDLFDVLAHIAYALQPITREERASKARADISAHFNGNERAFLDFVLSHYVTIGVEELDQEKLTPLLRLKYHDSLADAIADLGGDPQAIAQAFASFQKYLYAEPVA